MDIRKLIMYMLLAFLGVTLWNTWSQDYPPAGQSLHAGADQASAPESYAPPTYNPEAAAHYVKTGGQSGAQPTETLSPVPSDRLITVKTDVLSVAIDRLGGSIVSVELPTYPVSLEEKNTPVRILTDNPNQLYVAQSGITNIDSVETPHQSILYQSAKTMYVLGPNEVQINVILTGKTPNGLTVSKTYQFHRNQYVITTNMSVQNTMGKPWEGSFYAQLKRRNVPPEKHGFMQPQTYNETSISSKKTPYEKIKYKTMDDADLSRDIEGGWLAMQQHYFVSAWIPEEKQTSHFYSHVSNPTEGNLEQKIYTLGFVSPQMTLAPGTTATTSAQLYVGPEVESRLKAVAPGLDLTIDYGWLWFISKALFWLLNEINHLLGNWGWSIIMVTVLIKGLFYKLSDSSYRSMAKMRNLAPKLKSLKERYGDDKQKLSQATMEMYRKEKVNPLGGCLPMIVQIPVFIAFYYVLFESVELRQAPWILWVHDLSVHDPYYVLPILMGISMFVQQKLSPTPPDPMQAKMMMALPIVFTGLFLSFPAGLVLYWLVNNCLSILQQWYIMKKYQ
ncbi:MAG TPA: membrane protein insertase YidC [Coxiellaceae bacterium]|nr:membrane protein insertase YidC [Coxiellaceae bacterium]